MANVRLYWGDPEAFAEYNTPEEALLQAAHDTMIRQNQPTLRIEVDGNQIYGPKDFEAAVDVYREARNGSVSIDDANVVSVDSAHHLKMVKSYHQKVQGKK